MHLQVNDFKKETAAAFKLMRKAGEILLENYENPKGIGTKPDRTLVTEVDKMASEMIFSGLEKQFPQYGIIDEEHGEKNLNKKRVWVVDPLDGTAEYIDKTGDFGIIMGIVDNQEPVFGATYKPQKDEFVYATKDYGSFLLQHKKTTNLRVLDSDEIHALVSRIRRSQDLEAMLDKLHPKSVKYMGGSLKTVEVAKGNATLFLCPRDSLMSSWDICAPSVILEEAGGKITDVYGNKFNYQHLNRKNYNGVVATNGSIHKTVLERVSTAI